MTSLHPDTTTALVALIAQHNGDPLAATMTVRLVTPAPPA